MRYALLIALLAVVLILVTIQIFQNGFERGYLSAMEERLADPANSAAVTTSSSTPGAFQGPTGKPYIIGPSAPPPNF